MVCKHLGLLESDYFGLEYCDSDGGKVRRDFKPSGVQCVLSTSWKVSRPCLCSDVLYKQF